MFSTALYDAFDGPTRRIRRLYTMYLTALYGYYIRLNLEADLDLIWGLNWPRQTPKHVILLCPLRTNREAMLSVAGTENYKTLLSTQKGLKAVT